MLTAILKDSALFSLLWLIRTWTVMKNNLAILSAGGRQEKQVWWSDKKDGGNDLWLGQMLVGSKP